MGMGGNGNVESHSRTSLLPNPSSEYTTGLSRASTVELVGARFTVHGKVLLVFERQSVGRRTDETLGSVDDVIWIAALSDVIEVLAQLIRLHVRGYISDLV